MGFSSIAINTNPFFVLEDDPTPSRTSQIARATTLVWSSLKFCQGVRAGELEPDMFRTTPLCMHQYLRLFGTCRIPRAARDDVRTCAEARHIVVMCRGHIYWFNVLDGSGKLCISESILRETLRSIREDSIAFTPEQNISNAVGILTSTDRETWARCRETISSMSEHNERSLRIVDESLFVLCLDDNSPQSPADMAKCALHGTSVVESFMGSSGMQVGTSINRWYDKSLQLVVCQNGAAAINFEHSVIDGYTVLRFASDVFTETILRFAGQRPSLLLLSLLLSFSSSSGPSSISSVFFLPHAARHSHVSSMQKTSEEALLIAPLLACDQLSMQGPKRKEKLQKQHPSIVSSGFSTGCF